MFIYTPSSSSTTTNVHNHFTGADKLSNSRNYHKYNTTSSAAIYHCLAAVDKFCATSFDSKLGRLVIQCKL